VRVWQNNVAWRSQHQREARRQVRPGHGADARLDECGQRRVALLAERLDQNSTLARRVGKPRWLPCASVSACFWYRVLSGTRTPRGSARSCSSSARWRRAGSGRRHRYRHPECALRPRRAAEVEDDVGIGPRLARRRNHRLAELDQGLGFRLISKPIRSASRSKAEATGSTMVGQRRGGDMNRSTWA